MARKLNLREASCIAGYTESDLRDILGDKYDDLMYWMRGQTMTLCEGRRYNHDTREYEVECNGVSHGPVVYRWDLERYLEGRPVID